MNKRSSWALPYFIFLVLFVVLPLLLILMYSLQDASGNTKWNLATGALESKKFSINSTYFQLSETGTITSIAQDGKKIVVDKGTITGYQPNGQVSAKLEVADGCFNIAQGILKIQGVEGVSGNTSFIKGIIQ